MPTLVVLGGSSVATPALISALAVQAPETPFRVVLVARDQAKLERVGRVCGMLAAQTPNVRVEWTSELGGALDGAEIVLNQVRVGGLQARSFDESFPQRFGIPGEETIGPGGFANALRTLPVCLDYARAVERRAPGAWFVNLTNPAGMIQAALMRAANLRVVSVCDSPVTLGEQAAQLVGIPAAELDVDYIGMLHFGWIVSLKHNGTELLPQALERIAQLPGLYADPYLVRSIGAIPHPYLNYVLAPETMLARQRARGHTRAQELQVLEEQLVHAYETGDHQVVKKRSAVWYDKIVVPVVRALLGAGTQSVNARNGAALPWLPPDTIVETRCEINPQGVTAQPSPTIPPRDVQAMVQLNAAYEALLVEAILTESYETAWRALRLSPLVANTAQARALLDMVWHTRGYPSEQ